MALHFDDKIPRLFTVGGLSKATGVAVCVIRNYMVLHNIPPDAVVENYLPGGTLALYKPETVKRLLADRKNSPFVARFAKYRVQP